MALLTLTSTLVGWYNLRFISQVEKDNTQALIPTMNMARQLSEASAWELFAAQNLTSADNEKMWQAQGRMLTAQSLKINALLQALREQGFDTTAIEQQEQEISRSLRQQGELVGQRLQLRQQQQQLSQQIVAAADEIARLAQGQANNATTSAGATQAGIYDLIEQDQRQAAESALDRLIDIDLEYVNQMNELRLSALRVQQMVMNLGLEQIQKNAPTLEKQLNNAVKILQRRQIRIEDPGVRAQVATTLTTVSQYSDLLALYQQDSEISNHLQTLAQNNIAQFAQFSSEVSQLVDTIELRNQHGLAHLEKASAQLLADNPALNAQRDDLRAITDSGESLLTILNDILDYSAIEAGGKNVSVSDEPFEPRPLLESTLQLMSGRVKGRPIRLATAIADDMPCALMGDPRRIRQVITNLLSNALRFTDEGYIILRSRTDGEQWLVEVEDSGCGIDPAKLAEIFQPFVQVSGKRGGTGLGLTISSRLAQAMGGELSATSTPEVGSCFCLRLPLRVATAPVPKTVNQAVRLDGLRLLLIEDNPLTQRITIEMLKTSGAQIVAVGNAAQALETLQNSEPFAAALVDFDLPDVDGITLARQLAQQYPSLVLIGFSAHVIDETLRQRTSSLFRGIIPKPVPREVLGQLLAHYLQLQDNNDQSLDVSQLNEDAQLMGTEKIHEWLVLFTQHALPLLDEIDIARASQDSEKIKRAAHQLKSSCSSLGMHIASQLCAQLEQQPLSAPLPHEEITRSVAALEAWLHKKDLNAI